MKYGALALCLVSCTTPPDVGQDASVQARLVLRFVAHGQPADVALDSATASFEEMRVVGDAGDGRGTPMSLDLLKDETIVEIPDAPLGIYSRVRLRFGPEDSETLSLDGVYSGTPMRFRSSEDDEIVLRSAGGERLEPGEDAEIVIDIDRGRWFQDVDLSEAEVEDGEILLTVDEGRNEELAEEVMEGILRSFGVEDEIVEDGGGPDEGETEDGGEDDGGDDDGGLEDDGGVEDDGGGWDGGVEDGD